MHARARACAFARACAHECTRVCAHNFDAGTTARGWARLGYDRYDRAGLVRDGGIEIDELSKELKDFLKAKLPYPML